MADFILIGAHGWDRPDEAGAFYPEILPPDWRLSFYANRLRAVLLPAEVWSAARAEDARAWAEDVYPEFRFVVEVSRDSPAPWPLLVPLRAQIAGWLLRAPAADPDWLAARLAELAAALPVCVDLPGATRTPEMLACLARHDAGLCWRPDAEPEPHAGGQLLVALAGSAAPRTLRQWLERLAAWQGGGGQAALFFDDPQSAEQARLLAELMVV